MWDEGSIKKVNWLSGEANVEIWWKDFCFLYTSAAIIHERKDTVYFHYVDVGESRTVIIWLSKANLAICLLQTR